jgi:transcriptional regulator with XRE-family HTH domain
MPTTSKVTKPRNEYEDWRVEEVVAEVNRRAVITARKTRRRAGPADAVIGAIVRRQRAAMGLSQGELAAMIGVTSQQVHKYEEGSCKVDAVRLFEIARLLGVSVGDIEREVMNGRDDQSPAKLPSVRSKLEMARVCAKIDARRMHALLQMARALLPEEESLA